VLRNAAWYADWFCAKVVSFEFGMTPEEFFSKGFEDDNTTSLNGN
jgi:hypothetical protein